MKAANRIGSHLRRASVLAALLVAGCTGASDAPLAPGQARGPAYGLLSGLLQVDLLQRLLPLTQSYSASGTIGQGGGTLGIPRAGMTITFPAGAVSGPVAIRATALPGGNVAYEFEPHGITFAKPVTITQDLGITQLVNNLLLAPRLEGAYFANASQLGSGTAAVQEELPASVDLLRLRMSFSIRHFSGYAVASKRTGGYITSSGTRIPTGR